MLVRELKEILKTMDDNSSVSIEAKVNGVEFTANVTEVYESRNIYICGDFGTFTKADVERWWGIK